MCAEKGWISVYALQDECVDTAAIKDLNVTAGKIADTTITVGKLDTTLLKYLLSVARVDYGHVDYSKAG